MNGIEMDKVLLRSAACCAAVWLLAAGTAGAAPAPDTADEDEVFRVTGTALHVEGPQAEFCLSLGAPIDVADRAQILAALDLRKDGRKEKLGPKDLSLTPTDICVQGLTYRSRYDLLLRRIESADGERLAAPYDAVFVVPDRKPLLAFVAESEVSILPRRLRSEGAAAPRRDLSLALRAMNVGQTHLTLYRMTDNESLAGGWQQFTQINLSPSESLTFARTKGQSVFETDLVFGAAPNAEQTLAAPLPSEVVAAPGLYYLAATPKATGEDASPTGLSAGRWFLVSDARLAGIKTPDGIAAFVGDVASRRPFAGAEVSLLARDGKRQLAEAKTNAQGEAFLALPQGKDGDSALLVARTGAGDVDIVAIGRDETARLGALPVEAFVHADRDAYQPGSTASLALRAEDQAGRPLQIEGSALKLLRPDGRVYSQQEVPGGKNGVALVNLPLPVVGKAGLWSFSWQRGDGSVLATAPVRIGADVATAKIEILPSRESGGGDEAYRFSVRVADAQGRPLPFRAGKASLSPARLTWPSWKGFRFGVAVPESENAVRVVPFLTGPDGTARLAVSPGALDSELWSVTASVDNSAATATSVLAVRRPSSSIGVRARTDGPSFAENGIAQFDVVALDGAGKRKAEGDLYALIYEEGRRFEWFPAEGHWDYKRMPQRRRVGGEPLSIAATGETLLRWPVTTGQYALEIVNADGEVLTRYRFEAGRVAAQPVQAETPRLGLSEKTPSAWEEKQTTKIGVRLEAPAYVTGVVFDGKVRRSFAGFMPAGTNDIAMTPDEDWGGRVLLHVQAQFDDASAPVSIERRFAIRHPRRDLALDVAPAVRSVTSGAGIAVPVRIQKNLARGASFLSVMATAVADDGQTDKPVMRLDKVPVDADGRAVLHLNLPLFTGTLRLAVMGWNETQYGEKTVALSARPALAVTFDPPAALGVGEKVEVAWQIANDSAPDGAYAYDIDVPGGASASGAVKGRVTLGKRKTQAGVLSLVGREKTEGEVRFTVAGPAGVRLAQAWPLGVEDDEAMGWGAISRTLEPGVPMGLTALDGPYLLAAPTALPETVAGDLRRLVEATPLTTQEIAAWLEAMRLWSSVAIELDMTTTGRYDALRTAYVRQLLARQNEDGGFAPVQAGQLSDMMSTAAALDVLSDQASGPAALAVDWLTAKLQNTWFDEAERNARLLGLEALAHEHKADLASIRYFAETSRDKALTPEAQAALALALAEGGDDEAAALWLRRARQALPDEATAQFWAAGRYLSRDGKAPLTEVEARWFKDGARGEALATVAQRLIGWGQIARRWGEWSLQVNGQEVKTTGAWAGKTPLPKDKDSPLRLSASRKISLSLLSRMDGKKPAVKGETMPLQPEFIKLNGEKLAFDTSLMTSETYILLLKGEGHGPISLFLPQSAAFDVVTPIDPAAAKTALPWLSEALTPLASAAALPSGQGLFLTASGNWRVALVVRPVRKGSFVLPPVRLFDDEGRALPVAQGGLAFSVW